MAETDTYKLHVGAEDAVFLFVDGNRVFDQKGSHRYSVRFPVYGVQIVALAQNNTDRIISTPDYVTADFFDAGGKKIGSAFGRLNSVQPRSVKIFLMAGTDQVNNYSKISFFV